MRIKSDLDDLETLTVNGFNNNGTWTHVLQHCTGSIIEGLQGKRLGNYIIVGGRVRISVTSRTGSGVGIKVTLPDNFKVDGTFNVSVGSANYSDSIRNGEASNIAGTDGQTEIGVFATETYANVANNKILVMIVPPTVIKVKS